MEWYFKVLKKYADFTGRASREEYWTFTIITVIIMAILYGIEMNNEQGGWLLTAYLFVTLLPTISVTVRRLHDIEKSGWWYLINFVPIVGSFVVLISLCVEGNKGTNKYGPDPIEVDQDSESEDEESVEIESKENDDNIE